MKDKLNIKANSDSDVYSVDQPIPYGRQHITQEDIEAVVEVLESEYLTQGPKISEFEEAFADYVGSKYAVAVTNGTAALHLCAVALGVNEGDKVITTPITFAATANCIRYCGGEVVFADIDPKTYLLDIEKVKKRLEVAPHGTYKGIIPVDFAGRAVNLEGFRKLADEHDLWIIEDACHAPGGFFVDGNGNKQFCGSGTYADLAIFSFHPVKHIASGEGGMITTNDKQLYHKLLKLRTHGITKDTDEFQNPVHIAIGDADEGAQKSHDYPNWYMEMQDLGYNYRITDFQCALGLSQLQRADEGLKIRKAIAARYYRAFDDMPQIVDRNVEVELDKINDLMSVDNNDKVRAEEIGHAFHLYVIEVEDRLGLYQYLRKHKIFAQIHYIPLHLMPYYRQQNWKPGDFPYAEDYYTGCISLPIFPSLSDKDQGYVIDRIKEFYAE